PNELWNRSFRIDEVSKKIWANRRYLRSGFSYLLAQQKSPLECRGLTYPRYSTASRFLACFDPVGGYSRWAVFQIQLPGAYELVEFSLKTLPQHRTPYEMSRFV